MKVSKPKKTTSGRFPSECFGILGKIMDLAAQVSTENKRLREGLRDIKQLATERFVVGNTGRLTEIESIAKHSLSKMSRDVVGSAETSSHVTRLIPPCTCNGPCVGEGQR